MLKRGRETFPYQFNNPRRNLRRKYRTPTAPAEEFWGRGGVLRRLRPLRREAAADVTLRRLREFQRWNDSLCNVCARFLYSSSVSMPVLFSNVRMSTTSLLPSSSSLILHPPFASLFPSFSISFPSFSLPLSFFACLLTLHRKDESK